MTDSAPPPTEPDATLKAPQFSLRGLLIGTTLVAALLSVLVAIGTLWAVAVLFFALLASGHVVGNAIGTRLRDGQITRSKSIVVVSRGRPRENRSPPSRLGEHRRLHWLHLVFTLAGALAAGYFGGTALADNYPDATTAAIVVAHVSSGVLGGIGAFAVSTFVTVLRHGLSDAHAASDRHSPARAKLAASPSAESIERH